VSLKCRGISVDGEKETWEWRRSVGAFAFLHRDKEYEVDSKGFLTDFNKWDENFAEGMALQLGIPAGLTKEHWDVIRFIRTLFKKEGRCPPVYETCRMTVLSLAEMEQLFPTGYLRGACKLAGISSKVGQLGLTYNTATLSEKTPLLSSLNKTYEVDVRGFLVNPDQWDEQYAIYRAYDMKVNGGKLTDRHWQIIRFLRESYAYNHDVPTVYETCDANQMDIEELEKLFPDGYHRGAVKIAGLKIS
jgi:tRNA 2-thiouridine synthesizing protein E